VFAPLWQRELSAADGACVPSGSGDCGGSGVVHQVNNADRLYFVVESLGDIVGDDTNWAPHIEYLGYQPNQPEPRHTCTPPGNGTYVASCVGALRESDGYSPTGNWAAAPPLCNAPLSTAVYDRAADFRVAANNITSWNARLKGTVSLSGTITMSAPATLQLLRRRTYFTNNPSATPPPEIPSPWDGVSELTPAIIDAVAAAQTATATTAIATIALVAGANPLPPTVVSTESVLNWS
jgi:hypothetical protein